MITSFLYSVDLPTVSGTGIAYESGPTSSAVLYDLPAISLLSAYTVITLTCGSDTLSIRIDNSYNGQQLGVIYQNRLSFLFTAASASDGTESITATANYYDNVGPRQRALVQGYEA